jgi:uncharacterized protein
MTDQLTREQVYIPSPHGRLAGELSYTDNSDAYAAVLIANPHPLMGGAIGNNVVERLALDLPAHGCATLRFDYGGVGHSGGKPVDVADNMRQFWETGTSPADPVMAQEVGCVCDWLHTQLNLPQVGIGYSFGAYAMVSSAADRLASLVLISPTVSRHDFTPLNTTRIPALVIYSDDDFATPVEATQRWLDSLNPPAVSHLLAGCEHFYRGTEPRIVRLCADFIRQTITGGGGV